MPDATRTQRYDGLFPSQTQEMFDADARSAAEHDWYPTSETWQGSTLFVVYAHDPGRKHRAPAAPAPAALLAEFEIERSGRSTSRKLVTGLLVGVAIVVVLGLAMFGWSSLDRPGSVGPVITPTPGPTTLALAHATGGPGDLLTVPDPAATARPAADSRSFGDGTWQVGTDIAAGKYRSSGGGTCTWSRLRGLGGAADDVIATDTGTGRLSVSIRSSDAGFTSSGCGTWTRR